MIISFKSRKLEKSFNEGRQLDAKHGALRARKIRLRMAELRAVECLADLGPPMSPPGRCHQLKGEKPIRLSVDLDHPYRLLFTPDHDPVPMLDDGGLDWSMVTAIKILSVEDTHE